MAHFLAKVAMSYYRTGPSGQRYAFFKERPIEVTHPKDVALFRLLATGKKPSLQEWTSSDGKIPNGLVAEPKSFMKMKPPASTVEPTAEPVADPVAELTADPEPEAEPEAEPKLGLKLKDNSE